MEKSSKLVHHSQLHCLGKNAIQLIYIVLFKICKNHLRSFSRSVSIHRVNQNIKCTVTHTLCIVDIIFKKYVVHTSHVNVKSVYLKIPKQTRCKNKLEERAVFVNRTSEYGLKRKLTLKRNAHFC